MHVDTLEGRWIWVIGLIVIAMLASILYTAVRLHAQPPSNIEIIDSARLHLTEEFAEGNLGPKTNTDGSVTVVLVAHRYGFSPDHIELPAGVPVTFRIATPDTLHGLHIESLEKIPCHRCHSITSIQKPLYLGLWLIFSRLSIPGTNIDTMVVPGYVSEITATIQYDEVLKYGVLDADGKVTVPIYCNEFCGLNHHFMWGKVAVIPTADAGI